MTDGQLVEARRWINQAIAVIPDNALLHEILAEIVLRQGTDVEECIEAHARALALNPGNTRLSRQLEKLKADQVARALTAVAPAPMVASVPGHLAAEFSGLGSARHNVFTL